MEAVVTVDPELDGLGDEAVAAPERRQRNLDACESLLDVCNERVELGPTLERLRLGRRPGGELASSWACLPVLARLFRRQLVDDALDAHLPAELPPVDCDRGAWVAAEVLTLARRAVREEGEPMLVQSAQEHDASRRASVGRRGGERHGSWLPDGLAGVVEPRTELHDRIVGVRVIGHRATGCFTGRSDG